MERKHRLLIATGSIALSLAALTGCRESSNANNHSSVGTPREPSIATLNVEGKKATKDVFNDTLNYMASSKSDNLKSAAIRLVNLQNASYLYFDDFENPYNDSRNTISVLFYGGFPTPDQSAYRMTVDLRIKGITEADVAFRLYHGMLVLTEYNNRAKDATSASTKVAVSDEALGIKCDMWERAIREVGIDLKEQMADNNVKSAIRKYQESGKIEISDCPF